MKNRIAKQMLDGFDKTRIFVVFQNIIVWVIVYGLTLDSYTVCSISHVLLNKPNHVSCVVSSQNVTNHTRESSHTNDVLGIQRASLGMFRRPRDRGRAALIAGGRPVAQFRPERKNMSTHRCHVRALRHGGSSAGTRRRDQRDRQG